MSVAETEPCNSQGIWIFAWFGEAAKNGTGIEPLNFMETPLSEVGSGSVPADSKAAAEVGLKHGGDASGLTGE